MDKSLMYDRKGSYGTEQSYVGHISLIWDRQVSYGTEQFRKVLRGSIRDQKAYKELKQKSKGV